MFLGVGLDCKKGSSNEQVSMIFEDSMSEGSPEGRACSFRNTTD
jgi:hypothetical protein